ncbi:MAG: DUF4412 domain-containing protein [Flavobacteriales bacterium]|nr:DUF4412 domain-containing protein [Flavobacteriales bacterium]
MTTNKLLIFIAIISIQTNLFAQKFEGTFTLATKNIDAGETATIQWIASEGYHRMDFQSSSEQGNTSYSLYMTQGGSNVTLVAANNKIEIPVTQFNTTSPVTHFFSAQSTGQTKKIAGYNCSEYKLIGANGYAICWVNNEFILSQPPVVFLSQGVFKALADNNVQGIPFQLEVYDSKGKMLYSQQITGVNTQKPNLSLVKLP